MGDIPTPDSLSDLLALLALAVAVSLVVRLSLSLMHASELVERPRRYWLWVWQIFSGFAHPTHRDHLQSFFLGALEAFAYPALMAADKPLWIGAWIVLKALPRFVLSRERHQGYQRFLIGNALVLILSFVVSIYAFPGDGEPDDALGTRTHAIRL